MKKQFVFGLTIASAVLATGIAFTQGSQPRSEAMAVEVGSGIPNVVGGWSVENADVRFGDPYDANEPPQFSNSSSGRTPVMFINEQKGRVFAGYFASSPGQHDKMTGVVMEDGTITVQQVAVFHQNTPNRGLFWGKVAPLKNPRTITGAGHGFEELSGSQSPSFNSTWFRLVRVQ